MRRLIASAGVAAAVLAACAAERSGSVGAPPATPAPASATLPSAGKTEEQVPPLRGKIGNKRAPAAAPIGLADAPLALEAAASSGGWVAYCQARGDTDGDGAITVRAGPQGVLAGDELSSYLALAGGDEQAIDELLAFDESGRWLVIDVGGCTELVDTETHTFVELSDVDRDDDASWFAPHRALSFDALGAQLLYVVHGAQRATARLRDLGTGAERDIALGTEALWRAELSRDGAWALFRVIAEDSSGNGRLDWPVPRRAQNRWRCQGPMPRYPAWLDTGDRPSWVVAETASLKPAPAPEFVMPFGTGTILRDAKGALFLQRGGPRIALAPADCGAQVLHADPSRDRLLVACSGDDAQPAFHQPIFLVGPGVYRSLGFEIGPAGDDTWPSLTPRLVAVYPGSDTVLVDLERESAATLRPNDVVIATYASTALIRRGSALLVHDVDGAPERTLAADAEVDGDFRVAGSFAYAAPYLVDLAGARLVGKLRGAVLALDRDGRALTAARDASDTELARGPLTWVTPAPP